MPLIDMLGHLLKFKKRTFKPTNQLEHLLIEAAAYPETRPDFFKKIFHFPLFVVTPQTGHSGEEISLTGLELGGCKMVMAYSSQAAFDLACERKTVPVNQWVQMPALDLFTLIHNQHPESGLAVNHAVGVGKLFSPEEIRIALGEEPLKTYNPPKTGGYQLGLPEPRPESLIRALAAFAKNHPLLNDIYFGLHAFGEESPLYLAVLEPKTELTDAQRDELFKEVSILVREFAKEIGMDCTLSTDTYRTHLKEGRLLSTIYYDTSL
jgi:hypothetical protein